MSADEARAQAARAKQAAYNRAYFLAHRERILAQRRAWAQAHPEERAVQTAALTAARTAARTAEFPGRRRRPPGRCRDCRIALPAGDAGGLCPRCRARRRQALAQRDLERRRSVERDRLARAGRPWHPCADCGVPVSLRVERCLVCIRRHRYATDPAYRAARDATLRRPGRGRREVPA